MSTNVLYTDLSGYYDLMCADIDYQAQSLFVHRVNQLLGNNGNDYLDLACGTGPHIRHFIDLGYNTSGVDINQPMLDRAQLRCPQTRFIQQDMANLQLTEQVDLISCFLYSIHYNQNLAALEKCILAVYNSLKPGGIFCFNSVDKNKIDNRPGIKRNIHSEQHEFIFQSNWFYTGQGDSQELQLSIQKKSGDTLSGHTLEAWSDHHSMVAVSFADFKNLLAPYFDVLIFEHDYQKIIPWQAENGNAIFVAIKRLE